MGLRLHEKNGKVIQMPAHHKLEEYLDAYFGAVGIENSEAEHKKRPIFRSPRGRSRKLSERRMSASDAWRMIQRRALKAGLETPVTCHSFRGTGITNYLVNGGKLETAQKMAGHWIRTTRFMTGATTPSPSMRWKRFPFNSFSYRPAHRCPMQAAPSCAFRLCGIALDRYPKQNDLAIAFREHGGPEQRRPGHLAPIKRDHINLTGIHHLAQGHRATPTEPEAIDANPCRSG